MSEMVWRHTMLLSGTIETPLGRVMLAGEHIWGRGTAPRGRWRVYGSYALVLVTGGSGAYRDSNGRRDDLSVGDAICVFPELAHWYGPRRRSERWDEIYITFDGPVFALLREVGLLDVRAPVLRLNDDALALESRLRSWALQAAAPASEAERVSQVSTLFSLLTQVLTHTRRAATPPTDSWLLDARSMLDSELADDSRMSEVARRVGLPYETFRKRFTEAVGVSPARYRSARRIEAACQLLRFAPQLTNREAAEALGFADEFHFSRRFKAMVGVSPRAFRRQERALSEP